MKKQWILSVTGGLLLAALLASPDTALTAAQKGLSLCLETLLPSLLPYLLAGQLITQPAFLSWCSRKLNRIMPRAFHLPGVSALALCISVASGYPAGARMSGELARQGILTSEAANRTALLASHAGPAFIIGSLGTAMLGNNRLGLMLWFCHIAASLLLSLLWKNRSHLSCDMSIPVSRQKQSSGFTQMIMSILHTLALISTTVILFSVILAFLDTWGFISWIAAILTPPLRNVGIDPKLVPALITGMLEMTSGCHMIVHSSASAVQIIPALSFVLGFGGLSIHLQSLALLPDPAPIRFFVYKTTQALTSMLLTRAAIEFFPTAQPVFSPSDISCVQLSFGQLTALAGYILAVILIFYLFLTIIAHLARD